MTTRFTTIPGPLGEMLATTRSGPVTGLWFTDQRGVPAPDPDWRREQGVFARLKHEIDAYFRGALHRFTVALEPEGTPFQREVWEALEGIAYGTTTTYAALARTLGRPTSVRAVAGAVARNPLAVLVPCHRVVGSDGRLTGYAGGLERKRELLALEAAAREEVGAAHTRARG